MSNLAEHTLAKLTTSPLAVSAYFDETIFQHEQTALFQHAPQYTGHRLMAPEMGHYYALPWEQEGRILMHNAQGVQLMSNVCRHRQAIMLNGRGTTNNIVCPLHRWTYDTQGALLGAPHFPQQPCSHLQTFPVQDWQGLLFTNHPSQRNIQDDLASLKVASMFNFEGYVLDKVELHECRYNWKTFIEVYLEDYHVEPFHPGLGQFVTCNDLTWQFGEHYSVQTVGINQALANPGSPTYKKWHDEVLQFKGGKAPDFGAIWMVYYPHIMLEWYADVLVVSWLIPHGPQHTTNVVEFYYPEEIALFERGFVEAQQAAYMETCIEDDEIALRMDAGRKALLQRGISESGPYQSPMEDGMQKFHEYYMQKMQTQHIQTQHLHTHPR
jgi:choline monooxygenase